MAKAQDALNWDNPPLFKAPEGKSPRVSTLAGKRDGSRPVDEPDPGGGDPLPGTLIFEETWNDKADWSGGDLTDTTAFRWDGDTIPEGWDAAYHGANEFPANENIRISSADSADAYSGSNRCLKCFRESFYDPNFTNQYNSNGDLGKLLSEGLDDIYIEFYISFQDGWTFGDTNADTDSKMFRIFSSTGESSDFWQAFSGGDQGPLFIWNWGDSANFGLRNKLAFRGGPHGENYRVTDYSDNFLTGLGRSFAPGSAGDAFMNWTSDLQGSLHDGGSPQIPDKLNGGFLPSSGSVSHPQVFGPGGTWTKFGFRLKMNSAPNEPDGIFQQFLDDQMIVDSNDVRWVGPTSQPMPKWNAFSLGGNDNWKHAWDNSDEREEWYAFGPVRVYSGLPEGLL